MVIILCNNISDSKTNSNICADGLNSEPDWTSLLKYHTFYQCQSIPATRINGFRIVVLKGDCMKFVCRWETVMWILTWYLLLELGLFLIFLFEFELLSLIDFKLVFLFQLNFSVFFLHLFFDFFLFQFTCVLFNFFFYFLLMDQLNNLFLHIDNYLWL